MDKRLFLGERTYTKSDGTTFQAQVYRKSNNRGVTGRVVYGQMELYVSTFSNNEIIDKMAMILLKRFPNAIITRPFLKKDVYAYILGKKRYFTSVSSNRENETFFYVPSNVKDPVTRYKKDFLNYLKPRVIEVGKRMGIDLSGFAVRTGLFLSYYAVCFPTKHQLKFDYRLFAYKPEISDSVIIHEISHTLEIHHNDRFYTIVKLYCPNYDELDQEIQDGRFEGRTDDYVF